MKRYRLQSLPLDRIVYGIGSVQMQDYLSAMA